MIIHDRELTVRSAGGADAQTLCRWWNDGAVMAHAGFPRGLGTTADKIAASLEADERGVRERLILEIDGAPVGEMSYSRADGNAAEIGIKICEAEFQGRGLGPRALNALMRELFTALGFEKIMLDTNLNNTRAQHVYEKLGFSRLRVNENAWTDQLGAPQSSVDYEMGRERFFARENG